MRNLIRSKQKYLISVLQKGQMTDCLKVSGATSVATTALTQSGQRLILSEQRSTIKGKMNVLMRA